MGVEIIAEIRPVLVRNEFRTLLRTCIGDIGSVILAATADAQVGVTTAAFFTARKWQQ
jgi:hypothetical protein